MKRTIKLQNGIEMPHIGFGTYPLFGQTLMTALRTAMDSGCRLIDSAHSYPNEDNIGESLQTIFKESDYKREDIFLTSKIGDKLDPKTGFPIGYYFYNSSSCPNHNHRQVVFEQINDSLKKLRTDYVDLLLVHWPYMDCLEEIWMAFEELYKQGKARAIGVSNCRVRHLERIAKIANISPMVNQVYLSPLNTEKELYNYCKLHNIVLESYSPLMFLRKENNFVKSREIMDLCKSKGKTVQQIVLRWNLQRNVIPIPKSGNPVRIMDNYSLYDFSLTEKEMEIIDSYNIDEKYLPESRFCPGY